MYYADKIESLRDIFGTDDLFLSEAKLTVKGRDYPILDDVIVLLDRDSYPETLRKKLNRDQREELRSAPRDSALDVQFTFGKEWERYPELLSEYADEFHSYFDIVDLDELTNLRLCDLGCGIGRWSRPLSGRCEELVLVDFSEAIFVARRNLADCENALFFMSDLRNLPFRSDFSDFLICLGVLHHLPENALDLTRSLRRYAPKLLIYLYYALDNRPAYFRWLLAPVTFARLALSEIKSEFFRELFTWTVAAVVYRPLILMGDALEFFRMGRYVPLYQGYRGKSFRRIRQDVYDRFFTPIEQRFSREEIRELEDTFRHVEIADTVPYWHFLCER